MNKNPIEKLIDAAKSVTRYHGDDKPYIWNLNEAIAAAETYLSAIQSDLPKPLPTRERMIEIIRAWANGADTWSALADAILHDGQIKIGYGWVDPKSGTTTYYVTRDFRAINEDTAFNRSFNFYPNNHYFLEKPHAEAFRAAELAKLHKDDVQIGNGKWVKDGTLVCHITPIEPIHIELVIYDGFLNPEQCFLTEAEAEDQLRKDGFVKIGNDEWVKEGTMVWYATTNKKSLSYESLPPCPTYPERWFPDPVKAAEFLKAELDKETK